MAELRRAVHVLEQSPDTALIARGLSRFSNGQDLGAALNLPPAWLQTVRRAERDAALLVLRQNYFPNLRGRAAAAEALRLVRRHRAATWQPDQRMDQLSAAVFRVLSHGDLPGHEALRKLFRNLPG